MKRRNLFFASMLTASLSFSSVCAETVMFLTTSSETSSLQADITTITALEEAGYDVTVRKASSFDPTTELEGVDCIFISEAISSGDPTMLYTAEVAGEIGIGIINCEPYAYTTDRLPWIVSSSVGLSEFSGSSASVFITEEGAAHEIMINAGITSTGEVVVVDPSEGATNTKITRVEAAAIGHGTILATNSGETNAHIAAIEKGTVCDNDYVTTGRRVNFFMGSSTNELTEDGKAILIATVEWCIAGNQDTEVDDTPVTDDDPVVEDKEQTVMFLTTSSETSSLQADITTITALEEAGYDVTVRKASSFDPTTELEGVDCIFISEAISSGDPTMLYTAEVAGEIGIGIINCEPYAYTSNRLPWLVTTSVSLPQYNASSASVYIGEAALEHEIIINAGIEAAGEIFIADPANDGDSPKLSRVTSSEIKYGTILATSSSDATYTFLAALEKGTVCDDDYVTTGRRVHFFLAASSCVLTEVGKAILISTVEWCIAGNEQDTVVEPDIDENDDPVVDDSKEETILFLASSTTPTNSADTTAILTMEAAGYKVITMYSKSFNSETDLEGVDCIYLSETVSASDPTTLYAAEVAGEIGIGFINNKAYAFQAGYLPWLTTTAAGTDQLNDNSASIYITEDALNHDIIKNAGITTTGEVVVLDQTESGNSTKISRVLKEDVKYGAVLAENYAHLKANIVALEKGTVCYDNYTTTGRRVSFFIAGSTYNKLTEDGKAILIATVEWCIAGNDLVVGDDGVVSSIKETSAVQCKYANNTLVIEQEASVEIYAISGELCASQGNVTSYDCSSLSKGIYIARITTGNGNTSIRKISIK